MKNDYILIKDLEQDEIIKNNIILPKPKYNRNAIVLAVGKNKELKVGDHILKNVGKGTKMIINDIEFEMIHIDDIMAVIKKN